MLKKMDNKCNKNIKKLLFKRLNHSQNLMNISKIRETRNLIKNNRRKRENNESFNYEFDFSIVDSLKELSETNILLSEYRVRNLDYKYAKYKELDLQRKINRKIEQKRELS